MAKVPSDPHELTCWVTKIKARILLRRVELDSEITLQMAIGYVSGAPLEAAMSYVTNNLDRVKTFAHLVDLLRNGPFGAKLSRFGIFKVFLTQVHRSA
jgi:hypothetical protein